MEISGDTISTTLLPTYIESFTLSTTLISSFIEYLCMVICRNVVIHVLIYVNVGDNDESYDIHRYILRWMSYSVKHTSGGGNRDETFKFQEFARFLFIAYDPLVNNMQIQIQSSTHKLNYKNNDL